MDTTERTLVFVFTDIVESTPQWESDATRMRLAVRLHDEIVIASSDAHGGRVFGNPGDGFCLSFEAAHDAVSSALDIQRRLNDADWPERKPLRVRIGIHAGEVDATETNYRGLQPSKAARICGLASGGTILASRVIVDLVARRLPDGASWKSHGAVRAKGLSEPEHIYQFLHPSLPEAELQLHAYGEALTNLPRQLTSFVGRARDLDALCGHLQIRRLVTLTGAGGCGKTRLALQAAGVVSDQYPDGTWLIELSALREPQQVTSAFNAVLGVDESAAGDPVAALAEACRRRVMLLVVDNCEHLRESCAQMIGELLRACPGLKALATSREPLGVVGEQRYNLEPMPAPPMDAHGVDLERFDSVRLFLERASRVKPGIRLNEENSAEIASICRRLDGIPLALELAAAHAGELRPSEIDEYLEDRFSLLRQEADGTSADRFRTLEAAIDWSYRLLNVRLAALFRRCSVFAGGWTLDAALAVCEASYDGKLVTRRRLHEELNALVQKSLLVRHEDNGRYRMLESVREFALKKAQASKDRQSVRARWFGFFHGLAMDAEPNLQSADQQMWLDRLEADHDNLRAALAADFDAEPKLQMATALHRFWMLRGYLREGQAQLTRALNRVRNPEAGLLISAVNGEGNLAWMLGDTDVAREWYERSLVLAREHGDKPGEARALNNLGNVAIRNRDAQAAKSYYSRSLDLYHALGMSDRVLTVSINQGSQLLLLGEHVAARGILSHALDAERIEPNAEKRCAVMHNLAMTWRAAGDMARSLECLSDSIQIALDIMSMTRVAEDLYLLGSIAFTQDSFEDSALCFGAADAVVGGTGARAQSLQYVGHFEEREAVKTALGSVEYERLWHEGSAGRISDVAQTIITRTIQKMTQ